MNRNSENAFKIVSYKSKSYNVANNIFFYHCLIIFEKILKNTEISKIGINRKCN